MDFICHRVNKIEELEQLPAHYGVEIDLRDAPDGSIFLAHDPFQMGDPFEEYLKHYHHGRMILDVKSERVELKALELLKKYDVQDFFFLDSSFPMIHLLSMRKEKRVALRYSEYEGIDTIVNMQGRVDWVWIDCFTKIPINEKELNAIKEMGYKTCFVSPELENHAEDIDQYITVLNSQNLFFDAVCSKKDFIQKWVQSYKVSKLK